MTLSNVLAIAARYPCCYSWFCNSNGSKRYNGQRKEDGNQ